MATEFIFPPQTTSPRGLEQIFVGWTSIDHKAITEHTTVDLDFADALTPSTLSGSIALRDHGETDFFDVSLGYATVGSWESGTALAIGFPTLIDVSADGQAFDFDLEYVTPAFVEEPVWILILRDAGRQSAVRRAGYPSPGMIDAVLGEPAELVTDPEPTLSDTLTWALNPIDEDDENWASC